MAETTPNNVAAAAPAARDAEANKPTNAKHEPKKIIRLLTVMAYMMSVSMAALMLSAYYIFLWNPKEHRPTTPLRLTDPCPECYLPAGGGNYNQMSPFPGSPAGYNDSQMAETPRVLPAQEHLASTTPLSRLVQQLVQREEANFTQPGLVHS